MLYCPYCGNQAYRAYEARPVGYECSSCQRSFDVLPGGSQVQVERMHPARHEGVSDDARFVVNAASIWALFSDRPFLSMAMRWTAHPERAGRDLLGLFYLILSIAIVGAVLAAMSYGVITPETLGIGLVGLVVLVVTLCVISAARNERPRLPKSAGRRPSDSYRKMLR